MYLVLLVPGLKLPCWLYFFFPEPCDLEPGLMKGTVYLCWQARIAQERKKIEARTLILRVLPPCLWIDFALQWDELWEKSVLYFEYLFVSFKYLFLLHPKDSKWFVYIWCPMWLISLLSQTQWHRMTGLRWCRSLVSECLCYFPYSSQNSSYYSIYLIMKPFYLVYLIFLSLDF